MSLTPVAPFSRRKVAITPCSRRLERSQALWQHVEQQLGHVLRNLKREWRSPKQIRMIKLSKLNQSQSDLR